MTNEIARKRLEAWLDAESKLKTGAKSYSFTIGGTSRSLTRRDFSEITRMIDYWQAKVNSTSPNKRLSTPVRTKTYV